MKLSRYFFTGKKLSRLIPGIKLKLSRLFSHTKKYPVSGNYPAVAIINVVTISMPAALADDP